MTRRLDGTVEDGDDGNDEDVRESLLHVTLLRTHFTDIFALDMKSKIKLNIAQDLCGAMENKQYNLVVRKILKQF